MKVLFIGGTGNISTSVSRLAVSRGVELYLLNRRKRLSGIAGTKSITGDITDPAISSVLKDHEWDVVVNWIAFTEQDIERDFKLFQGKTKQYIFISSASAYQRPLSHPIVTESTPLANPYWQYSRNKIECEMKLNAFYREDNFPVTIVRPSLTYDTVIPVPIGGWNEYTIVDRIKKRKKIIVHGDGSSLWTITHAEDFAKGFAGLLGHQQAIGHSFHITSDELLTWNQIHEALAEAAGSQAHIIHIPSEVLAKYDKELLGGLVGDKATSVVFDNSKIKRFVPDFVATIPFREGIKRTIRWFESDPARMVVKEETNKWIDGMIDRYENAFA
ncbi:MAG: NAD-dependent epimerase/dehydratase family protein [Bacteroidota bacterium]